MAVSNPEKMWSVTMTDELYCQLPADLRAAFTSEKVYFKDYDLYKDDPKFKRLYKENKESKAQLEKFKFDRRHGNI